MSRLLARAVTIVLLAAAGLSLGGCSKCGFFWETGPKACRSDQPAPAGGF